MKGLELCEQRRHPFPELHLGEQDADGPVLVDEEVGALSAGPAVPALLRAFRSHSDAEPQPIPSQKPGKKLSGVLFSPGT